ncbi:alkaline phosphatase family protein [Nonomuraea antimicrobica]
MYTNTRAPSAPGQFEYDALNDRLPTVSWLFPPSGANEHPNQSMPAAGAQYIASKIDAIAANPDVWAKTVFILVWDENGGMFDHVPPPTPPAGTPDEFVTATSPGGVNGGGLPVGAGFRVGCIIVSPWTAGGWVCEPFEHTSNLRFLERVTGVECSTISAWRRRPSATSPRPSASAANRRARPRCPARPGTWRWPSTRWRTCLHRSPDRPAGPPAQAPGRRPVVPPRHGD